MDDRPPPPPPVPPLIESEIAPELTYVPWRAREVFFIVILGFVTTLFFSLVLFAAMDVKEGTSTETTFILLTGGLSEILFGGWVLLWIRFRHQRGPAALGLRLQKGDVRSGLLAGLLGIGVAFVATQVVYQIVDQVVRGPVKSPEQIPEVAGPLQVGLAVLLALVAAPVGEEILFRGFLYQAFRRWKGVTFGTILSAIVFGLAHTDFGGLADGISNGDIALIVSSLLIVLPTLALGVILAQVFERKGSLVPAIVAHSVFNLVGIVFILAG